MPDCLLDLHFAFSVPGSLVHEDQGSDTVGMSPDIVDGIPCGAADRTEVGEYPRLSALNCGFGLRVSLCCFRLDQRAQAQRGDRGAECVVCSGYWSEYIQALGVAG